ncbi:glycosyltransferase [Actinomadura fibrosa]|uniref:Glycosyltransferase n=1 Tax=Actinomadura fibrosa TaxID=111802 RepID=A0ABW2XPE3_9ACTN|nr:glycosyltransferase [Actinomadura fibrosa]
MRVALTAWGSRGDVEPLAALAVRLRECGAEARVCVPPDEEFAALLARAGVPMVPLGPTVRSVVAGTEPPSAKAAFELAPALVAARFETLMTAAEDCDVLLATGLMPAGARDVAEKLGIRYVAAAFHPFGMPSRHFRPPGRPGKPFSDENDARALWKEDAQRVNALYGEALNRHRAAIGLPPVDDVRAHVLTERPWLAVDPVLGPWQDMTDLDLVQTGAWILPDERPLPDGLAAFLDAGEPPVYVGFGSMAAHTPKDIAQVAVEAVRAHGRRVLLARGWAGLAAVDDRDDCFVVGEVNQQALFGRVAAVVHHGGAGTTTTAARAGAPQVIVPQIVDQPHWAARVAELGIGAAHEGPAPTVASLSAALDTALASGTRARAKAVAGTIRGDGTTVAANLLLGADRGGSGVWETGPVSGRRGTGVPGGGRAADFAS